MELGQKIRQARLEAGLSQRQLCGGEITRNMLSLIENGSAKPSMATLQYLASRLGKTVSFFLEEQAVTSPNQACMARARQLYAAGEMISALEALEDYRGPDSVFDGEKALLLILGNMALAEQAAAQGRYPYAAELLDRADRAAENCPYDTPALRRQRILLLARTGQVRPGILAAQLPQGDEELLLRAQAALEDGDPSRCAALLDAVEDRQSPAWNLRRGEAFFALKDYAAAAGCYHRAEEAFPNQTAPRLEVCYRELGDFKRAYEYACKQK